MLDFRLKALEAFNDFDNPNFGPKLNIDFAKITYYKDREFISFESKKLCKPL